MLSAKFYSLAQQRYPNLGVPVGEHWLPEVKSYEKNLLRQRN